MPLMKTANPALGENTFRNVAQGQYGYGVPSGAIDAATRMTLSGTVNKTGILLLCALATAAWVWNLYLQSHNMAAVGPLLAVGGFRRAHCGPGDHFQKRVVGGHRAHLCAA